MNVYRGDVGLNTIINTANLRGAQDEKPKTRCGYVPNDVVVTLVKSIAEAGAQGTGKTLHFAADLVTSGGIEVLFRILWDFALNHIGIASPRIFVYLRQRIQELQDYVKKVPDDIAYASEEFQIRVGEILVVIRETPRRTIQPWPKVGHETHEEGWIRGAIADLVTETAAVRKVWKPEGDMPILRTAGSQLCKAIGEGSTEKALFWVKWLIEEEVLIRKNKKGATLSRIERGPATLSSKQRTDVSFFILELYIEIYRELAAKQVVRMHEEFKALLELWRSPPKGLGATAKRQILALLTQILTEVPRWKVPAAEALIKDPVYISRAVKEVTKFFKEVLAYDPVRQPHLLQKLFKSKSAAEPKVKQKVKDASTDKMNAMDAALAEYFGGAL